MQVASVEYSYVPFIAAMVWVSWAVRLKIFKKLTSALVSGSSFPSTVPPIFIFPSSLLLSFLQKDEANVNLKSCPVMLTTSLMSWGQHFRSFLRILSQFGRPLGQVGVLECSTEDSVCKELSVHRPAEDETKGLGLAEWEETYVCGAPLVLCLILWLKYILFTFRFRKECVQICCDRSVIMSQKASVFPKWLKKLNHK